MEGGQDDKVMVNGSPELRLKTKLQERIQDAIETFLCVLIFEKKLLTCRSRHEWKASSVHALESNVLSFRCTVKWR
jgi:hypothetical protein